MGNENALVGHYYSAVLMERPRRTDQQELYQLLTHTGDVDLTKKLNVRGNFYNFERPHGAFEGKTPYEILKEKLK